MFSLSIRVYHCILLGLSLRIAAGQTLSKCPTAVSLVTGDDGSQFQICPGTDIQAPSINIVNSIPSVQACLQLCRSTAGCKKAVYETAHSICHIKGNPDNAPWVTNAQYDAVLFTTQIVDGSQITSCPTQTQVITNADGTQTIVCPMSDYHAPSTDIISQVSDMASCVRICTTIQGCHKVVYDRLYNTCHIKGDPTNVEWVVNLKQFDSASVAVVPSSTSKTLASTTTRSSTTLTSTAKLSTTTKLISTKTSSTSSSSTSNAAGNQGLLKCPANPTSFTTDDGSLYEICPQTDYQGPSTTVKGNILSAWDCLQLCNITPGCTKAVFQKSSFQCFIKDKNVVWAQSNDFSTVRLINKTISQPQPYAGRGSWSAPIVMPVIPVAAYVVPQQPVSSRVLMFSSWGPDDFSGGTGITQFADYNYQSGVVSQLTVTNTQHDMFCPGISSLQDGRIVITGGENAEVTSFYDPATNAFTRGPDMKIPRGYQSSTTTSSGKIFTIGGSFSGGIGGKTGEIYDPTSNTWTVLPGADTTPMLTTDDEGAWRTDNHAWIYGWKDGSVFQAGPSKVQHWYSTTGNGNVTAAGTRDPDHDAMCGVNVMYDAVAGKIFSTGGSQSYTNSDAFTRTYITTIGQPYQPSKVERVSDMIHPRGFANGVVLPDGTILITGGQKKSLVFTDIDAFLTPELFNPTTKTFTELAPAKIPRNYHSVSLLLADGTVFTGGGGMCPTAYNQDDSWCNRAADHPDAEIFSPPYLFNADGSSAQRPVISSLSSSTSSTGLYVNVGGTLTVAVNSGSGTTFSLIRMGSATHSINTDQRRIPLTKVAANQDKFTLTLPTDSGILLPGYYYLFALSRAGVPSIARTVQIRL